MVLPGETVLGGANNACGECGRTMPFEVCSSAAGYGDLAAMTLTVTIIDKKELAGMDAQAFGFLALLSIWTGVSVGDIIEECRREMGWE